MTESNNVSMTYGNVENQLVKLNNSLNKKHIQFYEVSGICDDNGQFTEIFKESQKFSDEYEYLVSISNITCSSFFPNIIQGKNNKFIYSIKDSPDKKTISFGTGCYNIEEINDRLQMDKDIKENIIINLDKATGKSVIFMKEGYKVYLEEETFKEILGYPTNKVIGNSPNQSIPPHQRKAETQSIHISPNMCEVYTVDKIFVHCDLIEGSWFRGTRSDILYSFSSDIQYGAMIVINIKNIREYRLVKKWFNDIKFRFSDDRGRAINFEKSIVSMTIKIAQI